MSPYLTQNKPKIKGNFTIRMNKTSLLDAYCPCLENCSTSFLLQLFDDRAKISYFCQKNWIRDNGIVEKKYALIRLSSPHSSSLLSHLRPFWSYANYPLLPLSLMFLFQFNNAELSLKEGPNRTLGCRSHQIKLLVWVASSQREAWNIPDFRRKAKLRVFIHGHHFLYLYTFI